MINKQFAVEVLKLVVLATLAAVIVLTLVPADRIFKVVEKPQSALIVKGELKGAEK